MRETIKILLSVIGVALTLVACVEKQQIKRPGEIIDTSLVIAGRKMALIQNNTEDHVLTWQVIACPQEDNEANCWNGYITGDWKPKEQAWSNPFDLPLPKAKIIVVKVQSVLDDNQE